MIRTLAGEEAQRSGRAPEQSLDLIEQDLQTLMRWKPGWPSERRLFDTARASLAATHCWPGVPDTVEDVWQAQVAAGWGDYHVVIARFVAAHAFASWMAYQGNGLSSVIRRCIQRLRFFASKRYAHASTPIDG